MPTYAWQINDQTAPGSDIIPITPSDSDDITSLAGNGETITGVRGLRSDEAGNIRVQMSNLQIRDLSFTAGELRVGKFLRVYATGTTVGGSALDNIEGHV